MATDATKGRFKGRCDMCGGKRGLQRIGELGCCDDCLRYAFELVRPQIHKGILRNDRRTVSRDVIRYAEKRLLKELWKDMHDLCAKRKNWRYREQLALIREMQNLIKAIKKWAAR